MGNKFPFLDRIQIEKILTAAGFSIKRQKASHAQWEGFIDGQRRIVTVDNFASKKEKFGKHLTSKMIQQSGLTKKKFYSYL